MAAIPHKTCTKCGRSLKEVDFFKLKTGERYDLCKDCLCQYIDNRKPDTFMWILKEFDVPYIEKKWTQLTNDKYKKNPGKFGPKSVIGTYLRMMNMAQYCDFHYSDSDKLNNIAGPEDENNIDEAYEEKLLDQLHKGEITETQYNTLTKTNKTPKGGGVDENGYLVELNNVEMPKEEAEESLQTPQYQFDASYWTDQLTDKDIDYLMLKWGTMYTPEE